jgi:stage II sporulation protein D
MKRLVPVLLLVLGAAFAAGCASTRGGGEPSKAATSTPKAGQEPVIRVLVLSTGGTATVASQSAFKVTARGGGALLESERGGTLSVQRAGDGVRVRLDATGESTATGGDAVIDAGTHALSVGGTWYAGRILVRANESNGIDILNLVPLETYLEGVVPHEIGDPGPDAYAAVQAQAVAARTYALSRMDMNRARPWDVEAGVMDQVYRGRDRQTRLASSAVRETRGVTLFYRGSLCEAYYSATCGGHTSDIRHVWPDRPDAGYLHGSRDRDGQSPASFCAAARNFRWRYSFSGRSLGATLRQTLPALLGVPASRMGDLVDVSVLERSPSGRVRRFEIRMSTGTFTVEGDRIRRAVMLDVAKGRILPSTLFDVEKRVDGGRLAGIDFVGGGNGHGVGMCQNGALGMARRGYSYAMILQHYYPGCELRAGY